MTSGLRRFTGGAPTPSAAEQLERCEMCGAPVPSEHAHVADVRNRSILCVCRACFLLFTNKDAGGGHYRAVPTRYVTDPDHPFTTEEWESLGIPVGSAFFLRGEDGLVAFYPSPAGATQCLLDLAAFADLQTRHPLLSQALPDVEAVLVRAETGAVEAFVVPIDACYRLVGTVRLYWQGFDGGAQAREHIDAFFADIRDRAVALSGG
jgi:hypothetical protein